MRVSKRRRRTIQRGEQGIIAVRRLLDRNECHPSWGNKRIARTQKRIERKKDLLDKKRMSKSGKKTPRRTDKYSARQPAHFTSP
jgi:hypothetical protein